MKQVDLDGEPFAQRVRSTQEALPIAKLRRRPGS